MLVLLSTVLIAAVFITYSAICSIFLTRSENVRFLPSKIQELPTVSIVVPTFDEETIILEKLNDVMRLDYPSDKLEIIVVDSSSDRTPKLITDYEGRFPLRLVREPERKGEATALNIGYSESKSEIIVKSDCDATCNDEDALRRIVSHFANPRIGGVSCVYADSYQRPTEAAYRGLLMQLQRGESKIDSTVIAHGAFVAFRRELIDPISPESAADDTELFVKIRKKGYRCVVDERALFKEIRPPDTGMIRRQRARRAYGIIKVILSNIDILFNPRYGAYGLMVFPSNFFMLVISPTMLALSGILLIAGLFEYGISGALAAGLSLVALALSLRYERPRRIAAFIHAQEAALLGLLLFLSTKPKHIWKKHR